MTKYDVIIVGGGPGGYVAAIRAAKTGKKTALVEADFLGGTCLNRGCIPSKTLLKHAEVIEQIEKAQSWGIQTNDLQLNLNQMMDRKNRVIKTLRKGIEGLLRKGKIDVYKGFGKVLPDKSVVVKSMVAGEKPNSSTESKIGIVAEKIIIATGSRPAIPSIDGLNNVSFHTTDTIFNIDKIPESLVIVGGGVIGVEFANIFSSLGTKITIVELSDRIIPTEDEMASKALFNSLIKKGVTILTNYQLSSISSKDSRIKSLQIKSQKGDEKTIHAEEVLMAVGRSPNLDAVTDLGLEMDGKFIKVNDYLQTSIEGIFAIGDVIGNLQLAHVASSEGLTAVSNLEVHVKKMNYSIIPRCIYTLPQVASVGMSEKELKEKNIPYQMHTFHFSGNGMALATGKSEGFSKVMIDKKYGEILGVVMVGSNVTEMISQSSSYMYLEGTVDELADMVQPHPSLSEVLMESANALLEKGIHS